MGLLEFLKKNKDARKIFGERELKIIEKQMYGVNLTQSEKNRLSRDIRKKLDFIKEASKFYEEFELKKGSIVKHVVNEAKEAILSSKYKPLIKKIYLFGSSVENQRALRSDIDIAVELDPVDKKEATELKISLAGEVNEKVDIQVYNLLPDKIKKEVDEKGKVIYERKD